MRNILMIFWLFLIPFCFINLTTNVFTVNGHHCVGHEQSALLHLKNSLIFDLANSKKLVHWNESFDCCQWSGVICSNGHVIALDLSEESISGGLDSSSSLFKLQYLHHLNLAYNDFHFMFPPGLRNLKNLRYLNLSNVGFEGHIPMEISQLTNLVSLDLSTSLHTLQLEKPNLAMLLQNLTEIAELFLDGVRISANGNEWSHALSSQKNLQVLSMSFCNLSGPIDDDASSLAKLRSLSVLRLNHNHMASIMPETFVSLANLSTLELRNCSLSGVFPRKIFQIPKLQVLDMSDNQDLHGSLPNFPHYKALQILNLSHTSFSGKLSDSILNLRNLSTLDLSNCKFNDTLPSSISELTELLYLDLSYNNFTGPLPSFNKSKSLTYLSLFQNDLSGKVPSSHFEGLENLESIDLAGNSLNGRIPSSLFTLPSLQKFMLSFNSFEGSLDEFPNASSSMLEFIDMSGNNLQGPIPESFFHLTRLSMFILASNNFTGTVNLDMMRKLTNLAILDLSHNKLSVNATLSDYDDLSSFPKLKTLMLASCKLREFPDFLRNQTSLFRLDLSSNQIHGTIPNWIWRFDVLINLNLSNNHLTGLEGPFHNLSSNLFSLDLHSNQIQGSIPILSKNFVFLDVSGNKFSSFFPQDIGNHLAFAFSLSLSNNSFHGKIHESFCNASTLRVLDLSYNNFSGTIPECLITRLSSTLRGLNLGANNLHGRIPDTFSTSCSLRFLDLNENFLGGTIPKSVANCQKLQLLNLGNNQLADRFPCLLKNISTLRVMVLRSNKFHGPLECPNSIIGDWETLQIVDLSSNQFIGTLPVELLRSWKAFMLDANEGGIEFGHLFFDIHDNPDPVDFKNVLFIVNKDLGLKLVKIIAVLPPFVIDHMIYNDYASNYLFRSYQDFVTVINKGIRVKLVKIFTAFTSLDFSSNHFNGSIPEELMSFKALHALNLSQNAFSGHIPSSIENLKHLESLDLSINSLSGKIPNELASLSFLEFLNLSYNHLVGPIPTGTQIQSFEANSFKSNDGLCGPPLTQNCSAGISGLSPPSSETHELQDSEDSIDWNILSVELGFTFGLGIVIMPLIFLKNWRMHYFKLVDYILWRMIPKLHFQYEQRGGNNYRTLRWKNF